MRAFRVPYPPNVRAVTRHITAYHANKIYTILCKASSPSNPRPEKGVSGSRLTVQTAFWASTNVDRGFGWRAWASEGSGSRASLDTQQTLLCPSSIGIHSVHVHKGCRERTAWGGFHNPKAHKQQVLRSVQFEEISPSRVPAYPDHYGSYGNSGPSGRRVGAPSKHALHR